MKEKSFWFYLPRLQNIGFIRFCNRSALFFEATVFLAVTLGLFALLTKKERFGESLADVAVSNFD